MDRNAGRSPSGWHIFFTAAEPATSNTGRCLAGHSTASQSGARGAAGMVFGSPWLRTWERNHFWKHLDGHHAHLWNDCCVRFLDISNFHKYSMFAYRILVCQTCCLLYSPSRLALAGILSRPRTENFYAIRWDGFVSHITALMVNVRWIIPIAGCMITAILQVKWVK